MDQNQPTNPTPTPNPNPVNYPVPQDQTPNPNPSPQKGNPNKSVWVVIRILIYIFVIPIALIIIAMIIIAISSARHKNSNVNPTPSLSSQVTNRANDQGVKIYIQASKKMADDYFVESNTYMGWQIDPRAVSDIQRNGSEPVVQGISQNTYLIYAKLPQSGKYFCVDNKNSGIELDNVSSTQTSCQ